VPNTRQLSRRWTELCRSFGAPPHRIHATWHEIEHVHRSPTRRYHTFEHVAEVLAWVDAIGAPTPTDPALELACWLHDIIYDTSRTDNEQASAAWASEHLPPLGADPDTVSRATRLIAGTAAHDPDPHDGPAIMLCDADLAILGSPPRRYERYAADVRIEYASLDDAQWHDGRRRVLEGFLARSTLYRSPLMRPMDSRARRNISAELTRLGRGPS
jgi:predicted metal-dependent HD superfamily phosphohydrolase